VYIVYLNSLAKERGPREEEEWEERDTGEWNRSEPGRCVEA